ncbi:MAG: hypothetical protein FH761_09615 [Firmicutes bacterium]|nr:hypothetical protein [Bacillota bacterium]
MKGYAPIRCNACNQEYTFSIWSRLLIAPLIPLPILLNIIFHDNMFEIFGKYSLLFYILYIITITLLVPFIASYEIVNAQGK